MKLPLKQFEMKREGEMKKIGLSLVLFFIVSGIAMADEFSDGLNNGNYHGYISANALSTSILSTDMKPEANTFKKKRCLKVGRLAGAISGSAIGLLHFYWLSVDEGLSWKVAATGIPATVASAYVGMRSTEWATKQIMKGKPKPLKAALKGAMYGAIDGAIILTASYVPFLITGYYLGTVDFNFSDDLIILKIVGVSILGGALYGGTFGAVVGGISGPCISVYMKF